MGSLWRWNVNFWNMTGLTQMWITPFSSMLLALISCSGLSLHPRALSTNGPSSPASWAFWGLHSIHLSIQDSMNSSSQLHIWKKTTNLPPNSHRHQALWENMAVSYQNKLRKSRSRGNRGTQSEGRHMQLKANSEIRQLHQLLCYQPQEERLMQKGAGALEILLFCKFLSLPYPYVQGGNA